MPQPSAQIQERNPSLGQRAADLRPNSWRDEDNSAVFVFATETAVREEVYIRELGGWTVVDQVLDISGMTDEQVQAFRGASVLNSHRRYDVRDDILGSVVEVGRETIPNIPGLALTGRISVDPTETKVAAKVKSGSIRQVSVGFRYLDGATIQMREGDVPLMRQPVLMREVSFVAVGADPNAHARSESETRTDAAPVVRSITDTRGNTMTLDIDKIRSAAEALLVACGGTAPAPAAPVVTPAVDASAQAAIEAGARAAAPAAIVVQAPAAPAAPATGQRSAEDLTAIAGFRSVAKTYGREAEFDVFANGGSPVSSLRSIAEKYVSTSSGEISGTTGGQRAQEDEQLMSHDEGVAGGVRSGSSDVSALASALAGFMRR